MVLSGLNLIALFSDEKITTRDNPLSTICAALEKKMQFGVVERDFVMLQHKFEIEHREGSKEIRTSTLANMAI